MTGTLSERLQGYEDERRTLKAWRIEADTLMGRELGESMKELEKFIIDAMPDNKLPLFINRYWLHYESESHFKQRLANAQLEAENVHYS